MLGIVDEDDIFGELEHLLLALEGLLQPRNIHQVDLVGRFKLFGHFS